MKIIQPSDATQQRVLPKYDFPNRMVNVKPGVNRVMSYKLEEVDGSSKIKIVEDDTIVFNRPTFFVLNFLGEKHIEFVKFSCDEPDKCEYCSTHQWVGPPCTRIPQPYPDYEADGYHYKNEKRAEKRQLKTQQERNKKYEDYNWLAMFNDGLLKKLNVSDLNKYLSHHGMMHSLKLRKAEKIRVIQGHIASHLLNISEDNILLQENSDDSYGESSSSADESSEDIVLNDTLASMSESETEKSGDEFQAEENVEDMFTTTRSGRVTTNWRVLKYK